MKLFRTIEAVADGNYNVGDVIAFTLNDGEEVEALAVKQEQDGMIFCLVDCLRKEYSMNPTSSNRGGYKSCALRKKLNTEILDRFPAEIREQMVAFANGDMVTCCACPRSVRFSVRTSTELRKMTLWSSGSR